MGEPPPQLGGEEEPVPLADALGPTLGDLRRGRPVERRVDLDGVEELRQIPQRIESLRLGSG